MRYDRQITLPEIGTQGQQKLQATSVLCVGAGGLGSSALLYLAAAGIGRIGIVDGDKVMLHNLHRQVLYREKDCGKLKSTIAIAHLKQLNATLIYEDHPTYLNEDNAINLIGAYDYILDCSDQLDIKLLLNDVCHFLHKPLISASVQGFEGQMNVFHAPKTGCLRCLFPTIEHALMPTCTEVGVLGVMPGILGVMQALELLKHVLGLWPYNLAKHVTLDANLQTSIYRLEANPDCILCTKQADFVTLWQNSIGEKKMHPQQITGAELAEWLENNPESFYLLDVRNEDEHAAFNIGGHLIPLTTLPESLAQIPIDKPIVVYCRSGHRSQLALEFLQQHGFHNVRNLVGGMLAWPACTSA